MAATGSGWEPSGLWRVLYWDVGPMESTWSVWCESSNEEEVRASMLKCPGQPHLQQHFENTETEWRSVS